MNQTVLNGNDVFISHEEFRTGADYSPEYALAMAQSDIRRAGYGGILRDHNNGADHGTETDLHTCAAAEHSERCDWAFKEVTPKQRVQLLSNAYRNESLSIPEIAEEAQLTYDCEPDPLDVLCQMEDDLSSESY